MASNHSAESKPTTTTKKKKRPKKKTTATANNDATTTTAAAVVVADNTEEEGAAGNNNKEDGTAEENNASAEAVETRSDESDAEAVGGGEEEDAAVTQVEVGESNVIEHDQLPNGTTEVSGHDDGDDNDNDNDDDNATARFDALVAERDALRNEVTQVRESLEQLQASHKTELEDAAAQLEETQAEKETAEEQYQSLLGKVNTIRSQLAERMKNDAEQHAEQIEGLEEERGRLQEECTGQAREIEELRGFLGEQGKELSGLRNRTTLAQQNWVKEREELLESEVYVREEYENAKQAMHDWEVLAMEERTIRKDLGERVKDLEEQLESMREGYEKAKGERDTQAGTVDGLQKALQEIQTVRKTELKEVVESSQAELAGLRERIQELQTSLDASRSELETTKGELERTLPFEKEVKEKNLLIGKLRHEAVTLSDHLTKALRFLKKGKQEDNVDRQVVTTYFLQFLALDRSDPKKFQILQLIAALLGWSDDQKEQAGLSRPGSGAIGSGGRLTIQSPIHRTPSTPALSQEYFPDPGSAISPASKETLGALWQNFLEQEATHNITAGGGKPRTASQSTTGGAPPKT